MRSIFARLADVPSDVRYGVRQFARTPIVATVVILTLALGVGANTAIFSLLDTAFLQALPVKNPEELRTVVIVPRSGGWMSNVPSEFFDELRQAPRSFSEVFAFWQEKSNYTDGRASERILVQLVSGRYYAALGVPAFLGRAINDADIAQRNPVAVLAYPFWLRRVGGDPAVIGKRIYLDGAAAEIIGITPPDFFGTDRGVSPDVTVPLAEPIRLANLWVTVRVKPGVSGQQAQVEAEIALQRAHEAIAPRLRNWRAADREDVLTTRAGLLSGDKGLGNAMFPYREPLRILILLSGALLLVAAVNIANVVLSRSVARKSEIAVRLALGASRTRLIQQLITENSLLSLVGTLAAIALAFWMHAALVALLFDAAGPHELPFSLNLHTLSYCAAVSIVSLLFFGVIPAVRATRIDLWRMMKREVTGCSRFSAAKALIVVQVGAAMLLLCGAGVLVRTFQKLNSVDVGMPLENVLTMRIAFDGRNTRRSEVADTYDRLTARVETIPGVVSAALGADYAFSSGGWLKSVWCEGLPAERDQTTAFNVVGPSFFSTARLPVLLGREFSRADGLGAPRVAVINEAFARQFFPGRNPLGRHVADHTQNSVRQFEVIGVVRDARSLRLRNEAPPMLYQALNQDKFASTVVLHVRTRGNPTLLQERIRAEIQGMNPNLPVYDVTTMAGRFAGALRQERMMAALSGFFGLLALLLTAVGIYGVIAHAVAERKVEIGVRMALRATAHHVRTMVLADTLRLVGIGAALGIPLALACTIALKSALFGVTPQDPATFFLCLAVVLFTGCLAGYLPALRASRIEPMSALRAE